MYFQVFSIHLGLFLLRNNNDSFGHIFTLQTFGRHGFSDFSDIFPILIIFTHDMDHNNFGFYF